MIPGRRKRTLFWLALSASLTLMMILWWMVIQSYQDYRKIPPDHRIGNSKATISALKEKGYPFSFLVIGDPAGTETAEELIETALKKGDASFLILLGDFVRSPDLWSHRFFLTEMAVEMKPHIPVFLTAGNHDIDYKSQIQLKERKVTPAAYEALYGSRHFDFIFNQCLFIITAMDPRNPLGYLSYLRQTLSEKGKNQRHIFVFIHVPPKGLASHLGTSYPGEAAFFSLLEQYKNVVCFFGDYHGHWRGRIKDVDYVVTGGGGRLKRSQSEWGKFHHILRVTVAPDKVSEEIITIRSTIRSQIGLEDKFEEKVFTLLFPAIQNCFWILYVVLVLLLIGSGYSLLRLAHAVPRKFRKHPSSSSSP